MRILCAPDKFKESLTAAEAAQAMRRGIMQALPDAEVDLCPIADGGEGTVDALLAAMQGRSRETQVQGPLGQEITARWGLLPSKDGQPATAVIEMAAASGLALVPVAQRDPTRTSTFGTGQLLKAAMDAGAARIIIGIGGSATTDGGCGMAQALGVRFYDGQGGLIWQPMSGGLIGQVARMDMSSLDSRVKHTRITVACDVKNPLTGPEGAAAVYGPQKGATPAQVQALDRHLKHLAALWREQHSRDVEHLPGAGAAGGLGAGLVAFLNAQIRPGVELVLDALGFDRRVRGCDLCLTGEGRLDGQSLSGKACLGVAQAAARHGVRTVALVGCLGPEAQRTLTAGLAAYYVINPGLPVEESMRRGAELLEKCTAAVMAQSQW